jgi:hypothetical protein
MATQLALLRYPKRLSPVGNDLVQKASIKDFIATENRTKLIQRHEFNSHVLDYVRTAVSNLLDWDRLCDEIEFVYEANDCEFTGGVGFDSGSNLGSKLVRVAEGYPEYFVEPFGIKYTGAFCNKPFPELWGVGDRLYEKRAVKVTAVPKSYKASRIIAMEDTVRQSVARAVASVIDRHLPDTTPIHDQEVNQKLALVGSVNGTLATLDLSHASDCISKMLWYQVFPTRFINLIEPLLGTHTQIDGKERVMQQMSTAGNSLTFVLESLLFNGIEIGGYDFLEAFGVSLPRSVVFEGEEISLPSAYGDDLVVATDAAATTIEFLMALGFIVNDTKSYFDGNYRESCGAEYFEGCDVSSIYFPRFPIEGTLKDKKVQLSERAIRDSFTGVRVDTMTSLISLQQRLYSVSYRASRFIYELVKEAEPRMTTSVQGSLNGDLWEYEDTSLNKRGVPIITDGKLKYETVVKGMDVSRRVKLRPITKYELAKAPDDYRVRLFNSYRYREFLKHGPKFSEPLLEALGISDAPMTVEQAFGKPKVVWLPSETTD